MDETQVSEIGEKEVKDEQVLSSLPKEQEALKSNLVRLFQDKITFLPSLRWEEYGLAVLVSRKDAHEILNRLCNEVPFNFNMLIDLTCVDWLDKREPRFDVVYQLLSLTYQHRLCLKIQIPEDNPEVDSVRDIWHAANFLEREAWDMFGVNFKKHGDLRRILMYDEFIGHPLRKDYPKNRKQPRIKMRIQELHNTSKDMRRAELVTLPSSKKSKGQANG